MRSQFRVSQILIVNTLCALIGPLLSWNLWWLWRYRRVLERSWHGLWQLVEAASR